MKRRNLILKNIILILSILIYFFLVFIGTNRFIYNISYTKVLIFMLLISLFIYIYGMIDNQRKTYQKNINIYIGLYLILLISLTFFIGRSNIKFYSWGNAGNYGLFYTIISQLKSGNFSSILINIFGNMIALIPLSFLLMIKDKKYNNIFRQLLIILSIIISIEVLQGFTHVGSFDVDDIFLNYFGTVIFTFIITRFSIIDKIRLLFYTDYKIKDSIKNLLFYLVGLAIIIYILILFIWGKYLLIYFINI